MHGAGPVLRTLIGRTSTRQLVLLASALIVLGALLAAFGQYRGGIVGIVGLVLLWRIVRRRRGQRTTDRTGRETDPRVDREQP